MYTCVICDQVCYKMGFMSHVRYKHKLTSKQYYDNYILVDGGNLCKCCGDDTNYINISVGYLQYCDKPPCKQQHNKDIVEKRRKTYFERTGFNAPAQNPEVKKKMEQTCLINHGCKHPAQNSEVKKKMEQTCLINHGCKNPNQNPEVRKKAEQTYFRKHGCKNPNQNPEVRKKIEQTCLKNHGTKSPLSNRDIINKGKNTVREKYGVDNISQLDEIKKKKSKTFNANFPGGQYNKEFQDKIKKTNIERYGVDNFSQTERGRQISRDIILDRYEDSGYSTIGNNESLFFIHLKQKLTGVSVEQQYRCIGYLLDGYIPELNIAIEYDEDFHKLIVEQDALRQSRIVRELHCVFIRVKDADFIKDADACVANLLHMIKAS